ncbi:MAG: hypothetical protein COC15_04700 [Legionellales bacterium]|nr:MAG: hypothetical protein COC15_04700 [Legionellales bacterium]
MAVKKRKAAKAKKVTAKKKVVKSTKKKVATKVKKSKVVKKKTVKAKKAKVTKVASKRVEPMNSNELAASVAKTLGMPATDVQSVFTASMETIAALLKKGHSATFCGVKISPRKKASTKARTIYSPLLDQEYKIPGKPSHWVYSAKVLKRLQDLIGGKK